MPRVKGGPQTRQRRKKRLKLASGQYGGKSKLFRTATESEIRGRPMPIPDANRENGISGNSGSLGSMRPFERMESRIANL